MFHLSVGRDPATTVQGAPETLGLRDTGRWRLSQCELCGCGWGPPVIKTQDRDLLGQTAVGLFTRCWEDIDDAVIDAREP